MQRAAKEMNDSSNERKFMEMAEMIRSRFHSVFWDERRQLYVDSVLRGQQSEYCSEQTNAVAYWVGLGEPSFLRPVMDGLYENDDPSIIKGSPLFQFYILEAWSRLGQSELAFGLMKRRLQGLVKEGASTFGTMWTTIGPHVACQSEASSHV